MRRLVLLACLCLPAIAAAQGRPARNPFRALLAPGDYPLVSLNGKPAAELDFFAVTAAGDSVRPHDYRIRLWYDRAEVLRFAWTVVEDHLRGDAVVRSVVVTDSGFIFQGRTAAIGRWQRAPFVVRMARDSLAIDLTPGNAMLYVRRR